MPEPPSVTVTPCPNGPILVRGPFEIRTPDGRVVPQHRRTVALCRCGKSTIKPYCDGTHKIIGFVTELEPAPASTPDPDAP